MDSHPHQPIILEQEELVQNSGEKKITNTKLIIKTLIYKTLFIHFTIHLICRVDHLIPQDFS